MSMLILNALHILYILLLNALHLLSILLLNVFIQCIVLMSILLLNALYLLSIFLVNVLQLLSTSFSAPATPARKLGLAGGPWRRFAAPSRTMPKYHYNCVVQTIIFSYIFFLLLVSLIFIYYIFL